MEWNKEQLQQVAEQYDKSIKLYDKSGWFMQVVAWILFICSFGKISREKFLCNTATTFVNFIFIPKSWDHSTARMVLAHEARHVQHFCICGLGIHPIFGLPIYCMIYVLLLLPIGLAFGRLFSELDCDRVKYNYLIASTSCKPDMHDYMADYIAEDVKYRAKSLSGSLYFYSVPHFISSFFYDRLGRKMIEKIGK